MTPLHQHNVGMGCWLHEGSSTTSRDSYEACRSLHGAGIFHQTNAGYGRKSGVVVMVNCQGNVIFK